MKSVEEKFRYNSTQESDFAVGYTLGVKTYRHYPKEDKDGKRETKKLIDGFKVLAHGGDEISKGFMCGIRDAANERKNKIIEGALSAAASPLLGKKKK